MDWDSMKQSDLEQAVVEDSYDDTEEGDDGDSPIGEEVKSVAVSRLAKSKVDWASMEQWELEFAIVEDSYGETEEGDGGGTLIGEEVTSGDVSRHESLPKWDAADVAQSSSPSPGTNDANAALEVPGNRNDAILHPDIVYSPMVEEMLRIQLPLLFHGVTRK